MDLSTRAVATACVAAAVAVAAFFGPLTLTLAAGALALLVAIGWPSLLDHPAPGGSRLVVALAGLGAVAATGATQGEPALRNLPLVLAMAVVLAFVAELLRTDGRPRLVESLFGTTSGVVVAVSCAGWIAAGRSDAGASLVVTCAVALAVASAVSALPLPGWWGAVATVALAVVAGGVVSAVMPMLSVLSGLWSGVVAGLLVAALHTLFDQLPGLSRRTAAATAIVLPVAVGGTLIFVVGRVIVG
ncbi:hypothetical protein [Oerskovia flava]|uniref:hypothetical protein n=1 Tax=Oerskovia flava TaxID=2986422 RepID=UPI00223EEACB|nr:hypothetical protein [Oerskovia sp. JB1-3-2]